MRAMGLNWVVLGLFLSGVGVFACMYLSFVVGLVACPLCIYQRSFLMAAFSIALIGMLAAKSNPGIVCALLLPVAISGLGIAGYHEYLIRSGQIECPPGLFGLGSLPTQSVILFLLLGVASIAGLCKERARTIVVCASVVLGLLIAWASVASAPLIPVRKIPYDPAKDVFNNCRPVYHPDAQL